MKRRLLCLLLTFAFAKAGIAQELPATYQFTDSIDLETSAVISQGNTGTCWSFSTVSFLESEVVRISGKRVDLSEMYHVRQIYPAKAQNYIMRQGTAQFDQGGLAHDVIETVSTYGLVPQSAYTGLSAVELTHNHAELVAVLKAMLDVYMSNPARTLSPKWRTAINSVLDVYLGAVITSFSWNGQQYTPKEFASFLQIDPSAYISLTSFTHKPYYQPFILNIPDNFSNGTFYNLPLDEFVKTIDHALQQGYTLTLDCDVSELSFSAKQGVAVLPASNDNPKMAVLGPAKEKTVTAQFRQEEFENYNTTDDHLMHITGMAKDQHGNVYYKVKNSWGTDPLRTKYDGYLYMSQAYLKAKAISVMMHRSGLEEATSKKL